MPSRVVGRDALAGPGRGLKRARVQVEVATRARTAEYAGQGREAVHESSKANVDFDAAAAQRFDGEVRVVCAGDSLHDREGEPAAAPAEGEARLERPVLLPAGAEDVLAISRQVATSTFGSASASWRSARCVASGVRSSCAT